MALAIEVDQEKLRQFCLKHHILKLSFFGSVLRDDFRPESDVDVLVEFDPEHIPTFITLFDMEEELSHLLQRKADLRTPAELSKYIRDKILQTALVQYAA